MHEPRTNAEQSETAADIRVSFESQRVIRCAADALDAGRRPGYVLAFPDQPSRSLKARQNVRGTIYFVGGKRGPVKIGFSTDVQRRLVRLQAGSPIRLYVLATWEGRDRADEFRLHRRFYADRLHGEWFTRSPEIEAEIASLQTPTGDPHAR